MAKHKPITWGELRTAMLHDNITRYIEYYMHFKLIKTVKTEIGTMLIMDCIIYLSEIKSKN